jgi:hypothetical protein
MDITHDPLKHLTFLRQTLSQDKKPIGFFLSAGCPLAVKMPDDQWPLIPDIHRLTQWIREELKTNSKFNLLLVELAKAGKDIDNIEDILSFLRGLLQVAKGGGVRGLSETDLIDLEKAVCGKIVERIKVELPDTTSPYHKLARWISSIDREIPIEVFTTNYDLLMEQAFDEISVPYFDGFVGSRRSFFDLRAVEDNIIPKHWSRLWKIHGSINWYQDTKVGICRSSEIKTDASNLIYPSHLKYDQSRKMPYLALIDKLDSFIRQKSSFLVIAGYSFNDEHINDTILNALKANPTGLVLGLMYDNMMYEDKDGKLNNRYEKACLLGQNRHNLSIWAFDEAIIGTNRGKWKIIKESDDKEYLRFIKEYEVDNAGNKEIFHKFQLGDFSIFSDFLQSLIGSNSDTDEK